MHPGFSYRAADARGVPALLSLLRDNRCAVGRHPLLPLSFAEQSRPTHDSQQQLGQNLRHPNLSGWLPAEALRCARNRRSAVAVVWRAGEAAMGRFLGSELAADARGARWQPAKWGTRCFTIPCTDAHVQTRMRPLTHRYSYVVASNHTTCHSFLPW